MISRRLLPIVASLAVAACSGGPGLPTGASSGTGGGAPAGDILPQLQAIAGLTVEEQPAELPNHRYFVMTFDQPADHQSPGGTHFQQRLTLLYRAGDAPMVLASTGYDIDPTHQDQAEPTQILDANEILVEHRFFTPSRPAPADWSTLTIEQAAADHHAIVLAFKPLFPGKWISTGASKGGMTSVYHRRFHPADVDGTIAYVAPESNGPADPRYVAFLQQVGDPACRAALLAFQLEVLKRRPAMLQRQNDEAAQIGAAYTRFGAGAVLDYAVIELPFTFWQYFDASYCAQIPAPGDTDDAVWQFLDLIDAPWSWDDPEALKYEPYYWQAAIQLGYPGYDDSALAGLLAGKPGSDVAATFVFPGPTKTVVFEPASMKDIAGWLATMGTSMMFVYGQNDPYSAAAFDPKGAQGSYRFFAPGGNHGSTIADLTPVDQQTAYQAIEGWTGMTPKPAPPPAPEARWRRYRGRHHR